MATAVYAETWALQRKNMAIQKLKLCEPLSLKMFKAKYRRGNEYPNIKLCYIMYVSHLQDIRG